MKIQCLHLLFLLQKKKTKSHYKVHLISKLLYNYRSVPSILHYYNKHFYGSSLKATVTSESREMQILANVHLHKLIPFNRQRDLNHAIYFCDVLGRDRQIVDNTSWCNPQESTEVSALELHRFLSRTIDKIYLICLDC